MDSTIDAEPNDATWLIQDKDAILEIVGEVRKVYRGFEKEILHLLDQPRHPESEKSLKYALLTLQMLNDKWLGEDQQ